MGRVTMTMVTMSYGEVTMGVEREGNGGSRRPGCLLAAHPSC